MGGRPVFLAFLFWVDGKGKGSAEEKKRGVSLLDGLLSCRHPTWCERAFYIAALSSHSSPPFTKQSTSS